MIRHTFFRELRLQLAVVQEEVRLVRTEVDIWRKEAERTLAIKEDGEDIVEEEQVGRIQFFF